MRSLLFVGAIFCASALNEGDDAPEAPSMDTMDFDALSKGMNLGGDNPMMGTIDEENDEETSAPEPAVYKEYEVPSVPSTKPFLFDTFQSTDEKASSWQKVKSPKFTGEWDLKALRENDWIKGDVGMKMKSDSSFHGLVHELNKKFENSEFEELYGSMEVQFEKAHNCGGAYFKLFDTSRVNNDMTQFDEHTKYSLMFGPDRCGYMSNKVHLIAKFEMNGVSHEEHLVSPARIPTELPYASHQYGFSLSKKANEVEMFVDGKSVYKGDLKSSFKNKFTTDKEIEDDKAEKPLDWVDEKEIDDPTATKPEDWDEDAPETIIDENAVMPDGWLEDEPELVSNPSAVKPEAWDDVEDGEWKRPMIKNPACLAAGCGKWSPPMISNPKYKGKWTVPKIPNPEYKGEWKRPLIENPNFFDIENPWKVIAPFNAVGFELWTVEGGALFDNIFITENKSDFEKFVKETYINKAAFIKENYARINKKVKTPKVDTNQNEHNQIFAKALVFAQNNTGLMAAVIGIPLAILAVIARSIRARAVGAFAVGLEKKTDKESKPEKEKKTTDSSPKASGETPQTESTFADGEKTQDETNVRKRKGSGSKKSEESKE